MDDDSRKLTDRLLRVLVAGLFTVMCYQVGHLRGYNRGSEEAAGKPIVKFDAPPRVTDEFGVSSPVAWDRPDDGEDFADDNFNDDDAAPTGPAFDVAGGPEAHPRIAVASVRRPLPGS